ncbi:DNA-binding protein, partial [Bacillus cereus]|nr:DNA-binding protein [Bacillus cereus]
WMTVSLAVWTVIFKVDAINGLSFLNII